MSTQMSDPSLLANPPPAISDYLKLDLGASGNVAKQLLDQVDNEVTVNPLYLSDLVGPVPANITPHMCNWYQTHIQGIRNMALHAVNGLFVERADPRKGNDSFREVKLGSLEEKLLKDRLACYRDHAEKNRTVAHKIADLEARIARDEARYDRRKAELGRDGKPLNRPLYLFVLIFVIFGAEAMLNLESFDALPWSTPMIAWSATIIVGLAIGFAAHFHGTLLKQYSHHFGPNVDDIKRGPAWRMFLAGFTLVTAALAFVYYARSAFLASYIGSIGGTGQAAETVGLLTTVWSSLIGNLLVYFLGTFWAYLMHDSDPDLVDLRNSIDEARQHVEPLKLEMEARRRRDLEQLNAIHKKNVEETRRASESIQADPALRIPRELFHKLQAKDADVVALLSSYRQALTRKLVERGSKTSIVVHTDDPHLARKEISVGEFSSIPIKLKFGEEH